MPSKRAARRGRQKPRIAVEPRRSYTDGDDAAELAAMYGLVPDPWQKTVLDAWLGRDRHDRYTSTSCGLSVPRQNGKNAIIEMRELYGLVVCGEKFLHTAHEVKTARKAFLRLASFFENGREYPELADMLVCLRRTNGQEAITLINGGSIEFSARSRGAARGFTVDCVVFDEAQELTEEQSEAILSTMAAAPSGNRQIVYAGTPPSPAAAGDMFARMRRNALDRSDPRQCWHEWSVEEVGDVADRKRWYRTNPGLGIRLTEEFTETECRTLSAEGFARERLGWWMAELGRALVSEAAWDALEVAGPPEGKLAYGVKFSPDGSVVSLAVAVKPKNGLPFVEVIHNRSMDEGTTWLAEWIAERRRKVAVVVVDGRSGVEPLVNKLMELDMPKKAVVVASTKVVVAAATRTYDAITEKKLTHFGQPAVTHAVTHAQKRAVGRDGGWGWGSIDDTDVTPVEALSLAYWGVMTTKRNPGRKAKVF